MTTRLRNLRTAIPYISLRDAGGGQTINGSWLTWDTIVTKTTSFIYVEDADKIKIRLNVAGYYELTFNMSLSGNGNAYFDIYVNGTLQAGSRVYCGPVVSGQGYWYDSCSMKFTLYLQQGDYVQIKGTMLAGTGETIANTSRLIIKSIPMHGWDNERGGVKRKIGGVYD